MSDYDVPDPFQQFRVGGKRNKIKNVNQKIVIVSHASPGAQVQEYETKWSITTPLTQGRLAVLSVVLGILALVEGYQGFAPLVRAVTRHSLLKTAPPRNFMSIYICVGALVGVTTCFVLYRQVKFGLRGLSRFALLPAVVGVNRHLVIARFSGRCQRCNGKLRFYAKPTKWIDHTDENGKLRREVTERCLAAECKRNPNHWAEIDPAEHRLDS